MYKIEKDLEMLKYSNSKYPFKDMEIGDAFRVPISEGTTGVVLQNSISSGANAFCKKNIGKKFKTIKTESEILVFRIK